MVREYAANVGGDEGSGADDAASTEQEKSYMLHLVDKFWTTYIAASTVSYIQVQTEKYTSVRYCV